MERALQIEAHLHWLLEDEEHLQNVAVHLEYFAYLNCDEAAVASSLDYILFYLSGGNFSIFFVLC